MHHLRFRQIHLDFHTSPFIPQVGQSFDKKHFQKTLKEACVNSITIFSKCHHGYSYHPTQIGTMHPSLKFDLLRAQFDACKEIDVNAPIYISAGWENLAGLAHPEWCETTLDGQIGPVTKDGWFKLCFHSPYVDYLCRQIQEVVKAYPNADGIFLDIIYQRNSCSRFGLEVMRQHGLDPRKPEDHEKANEIALERYYRMTTAAVHDLAPNMPVFHNSGHVSALHLDVLKYQTHLELESLPTGGWGYDHFPLSARYVRSLSTGHDVMGMTGKFHMTWGEFGGFKHPNALRYECAAMLAQGAKCSVGDQLHPCAKLDDSTYRIIGRAYKEVAEKEPWCDHVTSVADVGLLAVESCVPKEQWSLNGERQPQADIAANRILLEGHFLYDVVDPTMDWSKYKMMVLPDRITLDESLLAKVNAYLKQGGKLFLTGMSGLKRDGQGFAIDIGAEHQGVSPFNPDFALPIAELQGDDITTPMVMYAVSQRIKPTHGQSLGDIYDPYFNRGWPKFCSHRHTPYHTEPSGFALGVQTPQILYLSHFVFEQYGQYGPVPLQQMIVQAMKHLLGRDCRLNVTGLPTTGRVTLMHQAAERRHVLHLLYANTINRGGQGQKPSIEVIQELMPVRDIQVELALPGPVQRATLEPQGVEIPLNRTADGRLLLTVDEFICHQMVVLQQK